ncbi:hypothetical protein D8Y22_00225 [Salinadaptatus halalkaliphilus]|uniref:DUF7847 domain-containing protein n=1 Tax=Salinadaptatus halalkaliphilus TaxID=2419781 RepID=A0A4S3TV85_9EURY|nr:hypothetical protein [Salinadaptatus halalkaliphilus]THE66598.1 hypothetical protein D8Y22_00225 [Salinadaptatus halalkaliphilus]
MAIVPAFKDGVSVLRSNPVILLAGLLFAFVSQVAAAGEIVDSLAVAGVGALVAFLLGPFFVGGLIGMALEALEGSTTSLDQLVQSGTTFYVTLLAATILFAVVTFGIVFVSMIVVVFGAGAVIAAVGSETGAVAGIGVVLLAFLAIMLFMFLVYLFLQFFNTAIVVDGTGAIEAFSHSLGLVRANLLNVVGYSLLWFVVWSVAFMPLVGLELVLVEPGLVDVDQTIGQALSLLAAAVVTGIGYAYLFAVHTSYYTRLEATDGESGDSSAATPATAA